MKIDVKGYEYNVHKGTKKLQKSHKKNEYLEIIC